MKNPCRVLLNQYPCFPGLLHMYYFKLLLKKLSFIYGKITGAISNYLKDFSILRRILIIIQIK